MLYALGEDEPHLGEGAWVAPSASVVGRVRMGRDASLWFGAVARGDSDVITIGDRSNVQDCAVLHADEGVPLAIGADVTVGHRVMLHGCTIGPGTLVGIGAIVLNRAVIGKNVILGAHSLVTEGKEIPDGVLAMGSPARVVRALTPEEIDRIYDSAAHYVKNARRFRERLAEM
jgi:carbonic anhydrase/acetyltransferase-like protein (isoleucine patch superfamily)